LAAVAGAVLVSQFPAFFDQYLQSLGGRLDQARLHAGRIATAARESGLEIAAYLARFAESSDPAIRAQGDVTAAALADAERLNAAYGVLANSATGARPFALMRHLDGDVAAATAERFAPAAPLTLEGLIYAALGALLTLAAIHGIGVVSRRVRQRRRGTGLTGAYHGG
jgi:hypothetical protein